MSVPTLWWGFLFGSSLASENMVSELREESATWYLYLSRRRSLIEISYARESWPRYKNLNKNKEHITIRNAAIYRQSSSAVTKKSFKSVSRDQLPEFQLILQLVQSKWSNVTECPFSSSVWTSWTVSKNKFSEWSLFIPEHFSSKNSLFNNMILCQSLVSRTV